METKLGRTNPKEVVMKPYQILDKIQETTFENHKQTRLVTFLNPYSYLQARKDIVLFSKFDEIHIDGILLVKFLNLFGIAKVKRKSFDMTSLAGNVFSCVEEHRQRIFFIGSQEGIIDKSIQVIKDNYLSIDVCGYRHGYFLSEEERNDTLQKIKDLQPDIVVCGMGTGLQEAFLFDLQKLDWYGTGYTCGGFLHQSSSGTLHYYPKWINKYNLRWAYRIFREPRLFKRYTIDYMKFILIFTYDTFRWYKNH
jgi:N-acetylglucosaminyldiphosphoundecaprenol N-acetyl-beta-D-mannosaminyltransferase